MNPRAPASLGGPLWVLCHGTPLSPGVWDGVAEVLRQYGSVWQPPIRPSSPSSKAVTHIAQTVVHGLPRSGPVHLVGHSFGGQVALEAALTSGRDFESLTMMCSRDTPFPPFAAAAEAMRAGVQPDLEAVMRRWFRPDELAHDDPLVRYARTCLQAADMNEWATCLEAVAHFDRRDAVSQLDLPVHLIAAELDQVSTVAAMRASSKHLQRSRFTILADAAHLSAFRQPATLASLILSSAKPPAAASFSTTAPSRPQSKKDGSMLPAP